MKNYKQKKINKLTVLPLFKTLFFKNQSNCESYVVQCTKMNSFYLLGSECLGSLLLCSVITSKMHKRLTLLVFLFFASVSMSGQQSTITISNNVRSGGAFSGPSSNRIFTPSASTVNIKASELVTELLGNIVTINTAFVGGVGTGNVSFTVPLTVSSTNATYRTFTINAGGSIMVNTSSAINLTPASNFGNSAGYPATTILLLATKNVYIASAITTNGGIQARTQNNNNGGNAGNIIITGPTGISITSNLTAVGGTSVSAQSGSKGTFTINDGSSTVTSGGGVNDGQTAGVLSGDALTKTGIGTFVISGSNTYTGVTTISTGVLNIKNAKGTGTAAGGVIVATGAALEMQGGITVEDETLSLSGTGLADDGALRSVGNGNLTNTWEGTITLASALVRIKADASSKLSIGTITGTDRDLILDGQGSILVTGAITTGTGSMTYEGPKNVTFSGANTYSGATTIVAGTINLGDNNVFATNSSLVLKGGTIKTGTSTGYSNTMGTLTLKANTTFALGGSAHTLTFSASNGITWDGALLTITDWTGTSGTSGTKGKIMVGTTSGGLTAEQLAKISFTGYASGAVQLNTGEVVPKPAPVVTSATSVSSTYGTGTSYTITGSNTPTSYGAIGLPTGMSINTTTGVITVAATTVPGAYLILIAAINGSGTGLSVLYYTVTTNALTITGATTANKEYDQTTTAGITGGSLVGIVGSDVVTLTQSGTFLQASVGIGITVTSTCTIGGANAAYYTLLQPSLTARNIIAKALTVTGLTGLNKVYNGTTNATAIGTIGLSGVLSPDEVSLSGTPIFTFASANVGTAISISTIGYSIIGVNSGNYLLLQPTLTAAITVAIPIVTPTVGFYTYNGSPQGPATATSTGTGTSYTYSYEGTFGTTYAMSSTAPTNAGTFTVTATELANGNYASASSIATAFTLAKKPLTIIASDYSKCEGENHVLSTNGYSIIGLVGSQTIATVPLSSIGNPSNAVVGIYPIVAQNATGGTCNISNYFITYIEGTLTVNPLSVVGTISVPTTSICSGNSATITLTDYTGTIQWQSSTNGILWTNFIGVNQNTFTTPILTEEVYCKAIVTSGACASISSSIVALTILPVPTAVLSGTSSTCVGVSRDFIVTVTGAGSPYSLVYNDGSNDAIVSNYTSGSGITVSPLTNKTYTLMSVTTASGCSALVSGSAIITVTNATTTWDGTTWSSGAPTDLKSVIISGTFTTPGTSTNYNLTACKLNITNNATVVIKSGDTVTLDGALTVDTGSLVTFNSGSNFLQSGTNNSNSGTIVIKRDSSPLKRLDYTLWSSPVSNQQLQAFSPNTLSNRFYNYNTSTNFYQVVVPSTTNFTPMIGYLIRTPNTFSASTPTIWTGQFVGVPNNGNYSMALQNFAEGYRYNLIGNPYPSAIAIDTFIQTNIDNGAITGTLYFWRKTNGAINSSYCTYNLGGFVGNGDQSVSNMPLNPANNTNVVQVGQGFFVEGTGTGSVVFTNDMRINTTINRFFRTTNTVERNRVWLNITNASGSFSQAMIAYMTGATQGIDTSIDGKLLIDGDVYLASLIGISTYAIQGRSLPFDMTDEVPLSFKVTTAGVYTITIDHVDGLFSDGAQQVYLRDNITGNVQNLSSGGYTFTSDSGTFDTRFEIIYQSTLTVNTPIYNESQVVVYKTPSNEISINTGNGVMSKVTIYDIRGRLLQEHGDVNATQTLISVGLPTEILLVQITFEEGEVVTKKIVF